MSEQRHDPTLCRAGGYCAWATCSCGWVSPRNRTVYGAHLAFGEHLTATKGDA